MINDGRGEALLFITQQQKTNNAYKSASLFCCLVVHQATWVIYGVLFLTLREVSILIPTVE
jgi:hypothetical protein